MDAAARLTVAADPAAPGRTKITRVRSEAPISLRPTFAAGRDPFPGWHLRSPRHAWISMVAAAAGPIGGDNVSVDVDVGDGATLVVRSVAATLLLPGPHRQPSRTDVTIRVGAGATLVWEAGPVIAARGCDHHATTRITLGLGARLLLIDELLLGRHNEPCGAIRQRLRVCLGERPVHDQELHLGPGAAGSDGPAVTGGRRALGTILIIDPDAACNAGFHQPAVRSEVTTATFPLGEAAALITTLASDLPLLRRHMTTALAELDGPRPSGAAGTAEPSRCAEPQGGMASSRG